MISEQCALIGNGTSAIDRHRGEIIDGFGTVVRFNRYEIKGYEAQVGTKADVWFCGMRIQDTAWRSEVTYRQTYVHSWTKDKEGCLVFRSFADQSPCPVDKISHEMCYEISRWLDTPYWNWSTGALAIWIMLQQFPQVFITGFDWWDRPEQHYFRPKANRGNIHEPKIERAMIQKLQDERRVFFLP
jgi:hypothetical protein